MGNVALVLVEAPNPTRVWSVAVAALWPIMMVISNTGLKFVVTVLFSAVKDTVNANSDQVQWPYLAFSPPNCKTGNAAQPFL
jgi:hypothetical protein